MQIRNRLEVRGEGVETRTAIFPSYHRQPLPPSLSVPSHSHLLIELRNLCLQLLQFFAALVAVLLLGFHLRLQSLDLLLQLRGQQLTGLAQWPHGGVELSQRRDGRIHDDAGCRHLRKEQQHMSERKKVSNPNGDSPMHQRPKRSGDPRVSQLPPARGLSDLCNLRVEDLLLLRGGLLQLFIELGLQPLLLAPLRLLRVDRMLQRCVTRLQRRDQVLLLDWAENKSQKNVAQAHRWREVSETDLTAAVRLVQSPSNQLAALCRPACRVDSLTVLLSLCLHALCDLEQLALLIHAPLVALVGLVGQLLDAIASALQILVGRLTSGTSDSHEERAVR